MLLMLRMGAAYRCVVAMRAAEHGNGYRSVKMTRDTQACSLGCSFAQNATTMIFPHFVGDACSREPHRPTLGYQFPGTFALARIGLPAWTTRETLAISGRSGFSIASIAGRRFPGFPAVLPEDIHISGNNRSVGINQSM
jgi:hypothetical protein